MRKTLAGILPTVGFCDGVTCEATWLVVNGGFITAGASGATAGDGVGAPPNAVGDAPIVVAGNAIVD